MSPSGRLRPGIGIITRAPRTGPMHMQGPGEREAQNRVKQVAAGLGGGGTRAYRSRLLANLKHWATPYRRRQAAPAVQLKEARHSPERGVARAQWLGGSASWAPARRAGAIAFDFPEQQIVAKAGRAPSGGCSLPGLTDRQQESNRRKRTCQRQHDKLICTAFQRQDIFSLQQRRLFPLRRAPTIGARRCRNPPPARESSAQRRQERRAALLRAVGMRRFHWGKTGSSDSTQAH